MQRVPALGSGRPSSPTTGLLRRSLVEVGIMMGYAAGRMPASGGQGLSDAGYRLGQFWKDRDR
jgi:hypothetical protein